MVAATRSGADADTLQAEEATKKVITPTSPFFRRLFSLNDTCFRARDTFKSALHRLNPADRRLTLQNRSLKGIHQGQRCFILGTSPSIGQQDLSGLADEHTIAVNFFHKHPDAAQVKPEYWVIQDKKLWEGGWPPELIGEQGTWPQTMIDDVFATSPETRLFLPVSGARVPSLARATLGKRVNWMSSSYTFTYGFEGPVDIAGAGIGGNVMQVATGIADYLGFTEIYLLGISLDGLLRDLSGRPSHFYSAPPENRDLEYTTIERDLIMSGLGFRSWRALADYYERRNIRIVNLTPDGYLSILPRQRLEDVLKQP